MADLLAYLPRFGGVFFAWTDGPPAGLELLEWICGAAVGDGRPGQAWPWTWPPGPPAGLELLERVCGAAGDGS